MSTSTAPDVLISEVGPRDGLQSVKATMSTADKFKWIDALVAAGLREIEVCSFVPAKLLPQMADAALVVQHALQYQGVTVMALVPNLRGAESALQSGVHKLTIPCSASEAHSLANVRKSRKDMVEEVRAIVRLRDEIAPGVKIEVGLSTAFGCTIQGIVTDDDVVWMASQVVAAGVDEAGLSDTTGMANPAQVRRLFNKVRLPDPAQASARFSGISHGTCGSGGNRDSRLPTLPPGQNPGEIVPNHFPGGSGCLKVRAAIGDKTGAAHMHNTRGLGLANCLAAYDVGVRTFDSSLGGLGGCPYAPGASGNVVTEDLVFMFEAMGISTGVDIEKLIAARAPLQAGLPGESIYGMTPLAGLPKGWKN